MTRSFELAMEAVTYKALDLRLVCTESNWHTRDSAWFSKTWQNTSKYCFCGQELLRNWASWSKHEVLMCNLIQYNLIVYSIYCIYKYIYMCVCVCIRVRVIENAEPGGFAAREPALSQKPRTSLCNVPVREMTSCHFWRFWLASGGWCCIDLQSQLPESLCSPETKSQAQSKSGCWSITRPPSYRNHNMSQNHTKSTGNSCSLWSQWIR